MDIFPSNLVEIMAAEDFIHLCSDNTNDNDSLDTSISRPNESDMLPNTLTVEEDNMTTEENREGLREIIGVEHEKHVKVVGLDCNQISQPILQESVDAIKIDAVAENTNVVQPSPDNGNGHSVDLDASTARKRAADESPISGVKRARLTYIDQQPSVHVFYNSLTRESKKKLKELLQEWSEWQARHEPRSNDSSKETLEYGEETYFPALHVGQEKSSMVSFWMDNKARKEENKEYTLIDNDSVPLYDRGYVLGSTSLDGLANNERVDPLKASRCFNCGSYSHSLKECPRPRDNVTISNARKQHNAKKNPNASARGQSRYYQNSPGKFDDLKAGVLGPETRESLGIGEFDPPPWLHRMREIGYPPGYLEDREDEDQPSGITIYTDEETKLEIEEGELPERGEPVPPEKKMTVEFPGINAPITENADRRQWAPAPAYATHSDSWRHRSQYSSSRSSDPHRGYHQDHRRSREFRDDPSASDNGRDSSMHGYSPRYSAYDRTAIPRSPNLGRSLSERDWRGPLAREGPSGYGHQSPQYSPGTQTHYSSTSSFDRWAVENQYGGSQDISSQGRDRNRHDHHHHHRR